MAITIKGLPQPLHTGYNQVYFYADSNNKNEPNFRYIFNIFNVSTSEQLAELKIRPRYGDGFMEANIQKILASDLKYMTYDFIYENTASGGGAFNNTPSSGFEYSINIQEQWNVQWDFDDVIFESNKVRLISLTQSPFSVGDEINVRNAAEYFRFIDNQFVSGALGLSFNSGSHSLVAGDEIFIIQDSGFTYPQYNGYTSVTASTPTLVTTTKGFIGSTPVEGGLAIRNYEYDGLQQVTDVGQISGGFYDGYYYVDINQDWIDDSPTHPGYASFADGRITINPAGAYTNVRWVWNGALSMNQWQTYDWDNYIPTTIKQQLMTNAPQPYSVKPENTAFIQIFTGGYNLTTTTDLQIRTYDCDGNIIGTFSQPNTLTQSQSDIVAIGVGPRQLNNYSYNVIDNGDFSSTASWTISNFTATASIVGGELDYFDSTDFGISVITQENVLVPGQYYTITMDVSNNNWVSCLAGDEVDTYSLFTSFDNGIYTLGFTASGTDFVFELSSQGSPAGVNIDDITVTTQQDIIDCDQVCQYDITVMRATGTQSETFTFDVDCDCGGRYTNYEIGFMDRLGSFMPINFELNSKSMIDIKRDMFKGFVGGLNESLSIPGYDFNTGEHSIRPFNTEIKEEWELNSDWITEDMMYYMEELFSSPICYITIDGIQYSCNIIEKQFERKLKTNSKNIRYTIKIELSLQNPIQTG